MRVVVVGGHLTPALAVIEKLLPDNEVFYMGRRHALTDDNAPSLEYTTMERLGVPFVEIKMGKFQRFSKGKTFKDSLKIPFGFSQAISSLIKLKPDVVLAFGSYVSVPVAMAAKTLGIPLVIHEQTQEAGLANRVSAVFADRVCISYESSRKYFPKNKTILTGNPIRESVINAAETKLTTFAEDLPFIFITGGSQGSHNLNELVFSVLPELNKSVNIFHQTGDSKFNDFGKLENKKRDLDFPDRYKIIKFLTPSEFGSVLAIANLVIGRAGANTVNEILYLKKPAILVPLSFAQKEEQLKNAMLLKDLGLAEVINENIETSDFLKRVIKMLKNLDKYRVNQEVDRKNSTEAIIKIIKNVAKKRS